MWLLEGRLEIEDLDALVSRLGEIGDRHDATIQAFDARYVADRRHLERAVELADRAIERGENVARDRAVEILLYAAGRRQIDRALEMGVSEGENRVVVLVDGGDEAGAVAALEALDGFDPGTTLEALDEERLCSFFEITDAERAATDASLAELVCERVALLDVEK
ncbi:KEOPS complex subunit Cgi121 [Natronobeatus ordinarius]|uniref:KEOPS complex subunit Cgi121 n=1 Tax=Natronobeatus ordinarius TaxID=2963433 RepID=UPI0020CF8023|nr:KEOPS complex subunit Cgi121 [Natronobeatus ordinarius]